MAASSSSSRKYDVFPSFSGEDVRKSFLSHLLKELGRRSINTFIDHGIERSRPIAPELLLAIRESRISIVVFSKNYASSTWCLNELVEIHKCYMELDQMVIPVFYKVDPSDVRKQTREFGKVFEETCKDKTEDQKQRWMLALTDVANMAGEDLLNGPDEAHTVEKIANDVSNKLITPSKCFGDFVGIEAHIEAMNSILCLESEEARMVGILGPSGIGKSTIARALFSQLSTQFHYRAFVAYKRTKQNDYDMKLCWEQQFLSEILCLKDIKIEKLGVVEQRLKHKKVLIFLDDVDDLELLKTLVGQTEWFGLGSRIFVITQDRQVLKAHEIDLIYEVKFPSEDIALKILCRSAFRQNSPPGGFMELAVEVAKLAGNLPLGLSVLGSSLRGRNKDDWIQMLPRLRNSLDGKIEKTLRVSYDGLDDEDKDLFLYIACLFNGKKINETKNLLGDSVSIGFKMLTDKSLIRITQPLNTIEMHSLLQKLGKKIVRAESIYNPRKRRFLVDAKEICDSFTNKNDTKTVLGMYFNTSDLDEPFSIDENSFKGMRNLQFLIVYDDHWLLKSEGRLYLPQGLAYLPRKLRLLNWNTCPAKCLPSNFKAEYLVELTMEKSKLEKLWEGTQPLRSLKKMNMSSSEYLKEISDLSNAINLEEVNLYGCRSLLTFPSSIKNVTKLKRLDMGQCRMLTSFPTHINLESLEYLNLTGCYRLRNFPQILMTSYFPYKNSIRVDDCFWNKNLPGLYLDCLMRCIPSKFRPEHLVCVTVRGNMMLKKLWEGVQLLGSLDKLILSGCGNLTEIPDLSKATNLDYLDLSFCKNLVTVPTIGNLKKLRTLDMKGCTRLEALPTDVNLSFLENVDLSGCQRLKSFPQISKSIVVMNLSDTAIEEVPCYIESFTMLSFLRMHGCKWLRNISSNIFRLRRLMGVNFSNCVKVVTVFGDASVVAEMSMEEHFSRVLECENSPVVVDSPWRNLKYFYFYNCFKLDLNAREIILRSYFLPTVLPGGEVPTYFTHRASGDTLTVTLPQSSLSLDFLIFKACVVVEPLTNLMDICLDLEVHLHFRGVRHSWDTKFENMLALCKTDHLVLCSFKFRPIGFPFKFNYNDVDFEFICNGRIKGCGVRVLNISPEIEHNEQFGEKCDVVIETGRSKKRMRMTLGTSEETSNLSCGQIVAHKRLTAPNLELIIWRGEAYPHVSSRRKPYDTTRKIVIYSIL